VHSGHLKIAELVKKQFGIKNVLFVPAYKPPHKDFDPKMSMHRLKMLELAVGKENVSDIEYRRETPSYTYHTARELNKKYGRFDFIIGYDAFKQIESWFEAAKLPQLMDFIVIPRNKGEDFSHLKEKGYNFKILETDFIDVSSEKIRTLIKSGFDAGKFLDKRVKEYIKENGLYA